MSGKQRKRPSGLDRMTVDYPVRVVRKPDKDRDGGRTLGAAVMAELHARRDDPYHPAALGTDAGPKVRKFNPGQARNPHTGEWIDTTPGDGNRWPGMPDRLVDIALKVAGGGTLHVGAEPDREGHATLSVGDRSASLSKGDIERFRKAIVHAQYDMDEHRDGYGLYAVRHRGGPGKPSEPLVALRPVPGKYITETGKRLTSLNDAPDDEEVYNAEFDLFVGRSPNDPDGDFGSDTEQGTRVSLKDLYSNRRDLYDTLLNTTSARRVDTGNGPTDVYVPRAGAVGLRMKDDKGSPTEVILNVRDYRRIDSAIDDAIFGPGEGFDDAELAQQHDITKVVETSGGPVEIRFRGRRVNGEYSADSTLTITPQRGAGWSVAASGQKIEDFWHALRDNAQAAGIAEL